MIVSLLFVIAPMITVFLFDSMTFINQPFYRYLDLTYLYTKLFSQTKYLVVWFCMSGLILMMMTKKLAYLQNNNEHGSAKWADKSELNRFFARKTLTRDGFKGKPTEGGLVIKKVGNRIWHEMQCIHSLVIGTTSSGKTRKTLIPSMAIASQATSSNTKYLKVRVLSESKYEKYKRRMEFIRNYTFHNQYILDDLIIWKNQKMKKIYKFLHIPYAKRIIMTVKETINLEDNFAVKNLEDKKIDYLVKGPGDIVGEILHPRNTGIIKIKMNIEVYKESFFVNDPKKELYKMMKKYLEKKGYTVYLLDLRKQWTGDQWNPMTSVVRCLKENNTDEADMYAKDIAAALCPESKMSEKIWTDGERAIIAALILAVAGADCDDSQKNLYTCYQILNTLGQPDEDDHVLLNDYFNNLPVGHIARTAFGPAALATDRTRMSFYVSASATLGMFSSMMVAKQTSLSTFDITQFSNKPTAIFLVNPDEKSNMNSLSNLFIDEIYRVLSIEANKTDGKLLRKFHFFWDEMPASDKQPELPKKLSIARGRNIQFHLYIQDFGQLEEIYGKEVTNTIKANCNLMIYISTQNLETAKEISEKIGNKTVHTQSISHQSGESIFIEDKGNITESLMARPLMNANELMKLEDGKAIVIRMRMNPILTTLEDCSQYDFFDTLEYTLEEPVRNDGTLIAYIPDIEQKSIFSEPLNLHIDKKI